MPTPSRPTALALARAMLAGPPDASGVAARMRACLGSCLGAEAAWHGPLAERCMNLAGARWQGLSARSLATLIERDDGYVQAWLAPQQPRVRGYFIGAGDSLQLPPSALYPGLHPGMQHSPLPNWPDTPSLAQALGVSEGGLWRLTRSADWQRRSPLGQQHHHYRLTPKRSGGWRLLEVPLPYLMGLQRQVLKQLLNHIPPHPAARGYTRGLSVVDHARAHVGQAVVLKFDLQDFFTSVRASRVHALFTTLGYPTAVARGLTALCTTATPEPVLRRLHEDGGLAWQQLQRLRGPHLAQGAPTSAALANLCACRLDLRLQGLALKLGAQYTRYADDIVLSGAAHLGTALPRIEAWVGFIARQEGFALNHRKTRCLVAGQRQTVCNIVVNQQVNLPRDAFDRLKATLYQCIQRGPAAQNREGHADWRGHLQGRVAWARQLNPSKAERLQRLFEQIDWGL